MSNVMVMFHAGPALWLCSMRMHRDTKASTADMDWLLAGWTRIQTFVGIPLSFRVQTNQLYSKFRFHNADLYAWKVSLPTPQLMVVSSCPPHRLLYGPWGPADLARYHPSWAQKIISVGFWWKDMDRLQVNIGNPRCSYHLHSFGQEFASFVSPLYLVVLESLLESQNGLAKWTHMQR
jgi:hypothetical protein